MYIGWFTSLLIILFGLVTFLKGAINTSKVNDINTAIAYTNNRLQWNERFINFINLQKNVDYDELTGYNTNGENTLLTGLLFTFDFSPDITGYVFIPNKDLNSKYFIKIFDTKIETIGEIAPYNIVIGKGIIGSYYYSGNTNTGYVYNAIDNTKICYYNKEQHSCK